jgi:hypothetical protein
MNSPLHSNFPGPSTRRKFVSCFVAMAKKEETKAENNLLILSFLHFRASLLVPQMGCESPFDHFSSTLLLAVGSKRSGWTLSILCKL